VNKLYNGIIVGGADDHGSSTRSGATLYDVDATSGTSSVNWSPSGTAPKFGFELPHLAAAAVGVDTAGAGPGWVDTVGGTSLAAPQISALVADIQEGNPTIAYWPEVMQVGLMASANENIDEAYSGVWPPSLSDNVDDKDGAGLVHAWLSAIVLSSGAKQNGGNPAIHYGHDYGSVYASSTPAGTLYPEEYTVSVPPGTTLRVYSTTFNQLVCTSPDSGSCGVGALVLHSLRLYSGGSQVAVSAATNTNYQVVGAYNWTGSTQTYTVRMRSEYWPTGVSSTTWAIAWWATT
jgi:hypothetical protein